MNRWVATGIRSLLGLALLAACGGLDDDVSLGNHDQPRAVEGPRFPARPPLSPGAPVIPPDPEAGACDELPTGCTAAHEPWNVTGEGLYKFVLDDTHLYWIRIGNEHQIWRAHRVSGQKERLLVTAPNVFSIAVDGTHLYFTHTPSVFETGGVHRMPKAGGTVEVLVSDTFNPTQLTLDRTHAYYNVGSGIFGEWRGEVYRVAKAGGPPELIASPLDNPWDFQVDDTHLFVSEMNAGCIQRFPKTGGPPRTLFTAYATSELALLGEFAYFTYVADVAECVPATCPPQVLRLARIPLSGGDPELLLEMPSNDALATRSDAAVWANWLVPIDGAPSRLVPDDYEISAVAADDSEIFLGSYAGAIYKIVR